ncbi:lysozyme inhibitor LprI family protein [Acinetobacter rathckeae]|uniref:lysozyme inhibitor LprI family protein n=1 Tax=Acinetobacter rathckeae TaxID=2605272 RepID=UPI0018A27DCF|nr:lysozyme inhibitor LprI family protein [Acinetobacter rathckeae]MBF7687084.1 DUF1311 domain-containing protein [Acinetobacter rathckeae]
MKKLLTASLLATLSFGAFAEQQDCESKYKEPADIAICYEKSSLDEVEVRFKKLKTLGKDQISYDKGILARLDGSQRSWIKYRDDYCSVYSSFHSEINNNANCIIQLNNDRAKQLQNDIDTN